MYLDRHLSWDVHILQLSKKLSTANGILSKLRHNVPKKVCLDVYYALFYSHLNYGCNLWGTATKENIDKIVKLLKKMCKNDYIL